MFASDKMKIGLICMLSIFISACSSSPEFTAKSGGPGRVLLSAYYGDLLLQIYDKNVDASWRLDVESSSMTINGTKFQLRSAKRQEYVTKQNGFAYFIYLQDDDLTEGEYLVEVAKYGVRLDFWASAPVFTAISSLTAPKSSILSGRQLS